MIGNMVTKEDFSLEQLEWFSNQLLLRRQANRFISVSILSHVNDWLIDDEHVCSFLSEYIDSVIDEMRRVLSKEDYEKVKLILTGSNYLGDNM
jgi:hypothetical protein